MTRAKAPLKRLAKLMGAITWPRMAVNTSTHTSLSSHLHPLTLIRIVLEGPTMTDVFSMEPLQNGEWFGVHEGDSWNG